MGFEGLNSLIGAIAGAIIGAMISSLAVMFYGERWVETLRRRREHSIKLKDDVLKPWLAKIGEYCKIDAVYSRDVDKMVGVEPQDPTDLEFFDVAKSHLESKHPEILKDWEELKHVTFKHNKELATFLEKIRTLTIEELKMPCYYSNLPGEAPEEYIAVNRFVENAYEEVEFSLRTGRKWAIGKPAIRPVTYGNEKFCELEWGSYRLVKSRNEKEVERARFLIDKIVEKAEFREEVKDLIKKEDQIFKIKRENFEQKIREVIKSIEAGNILKGKCRFCP